MMNVCGKKCVRQIMKYAVSLLQYIVNNADILKY